MRDIPFIEGDKFYLRELRRGDLNGNWYTWLNDIVVTRFQNKGIFPNTREKQEEYFGRISQSKNDVMFAIVDCESEKHIGNVALHNIDWVHRSAEVGIIIGEKEFWNRGYGRKAWGLITRYGFDILNLHRIYAWILKDNVPSLKSAMAAGFRQEGEVRDYLYKNGEFHTMLYMNILAEDRC